MRNYTFNSVRAKYAKEICKLKKCELTPERVKEILAMYDMTMINVLSEYIERGTAPQ